MKHLPFRVEFDLCAPLETDFVPVHLDGLLAWAYLQEEVTAYLNNERPNAPNPADVNSDLYASLPLRREQGVYCASMILPSEVVGSSVRYFVRGSDAESLATFGIRESSGAGTLIRNMKNVRAIQTQRGPLKSVFETRQVQHVPMCLAYGVGDIEVIHKLLTNHVTGLGKNRAKGYGSVSEIRVIEDKEGLENWKMRAMARPFEGSMPMISPTRPPYWNKSLRVIAHVPKAIF